MAPAVATYEPRDPSRTVLYKVIAEHLEIFLASLDADPDAKGLHGHLSVLPTWITTHHCCHHPRSGDHAHPASSEACSRPTPHCSRPFLPRDVRLGRLSP